MNSDGMDNNDSFNTFELLTRLAMGILLNINDDER